MLKLCPICGFIGDFFEIRKADEQHPHQELGCPYCRSTGRHRLIWLVYEKLKERRRDLSGKMLHCSPMKCLKEKFIKDFTYVSIDFPPRESASGVTMADLNEDLRNTSFQNDYFNIIVCINVLNEIREVEQAIKEMYRILKPGGIAFLVVSIWKEEKSRRLEKMEWNRWWHCGLDFFEKYAEAGFRVEVINNTHIKDYERYGLTEDYLALCYK